MTIRFLAASSAAFAMTALAAPAALAESDFAAPSGEYTSEETHRYITFSYMHLGLSRPTVRWNSWDATLDWNADDVEASSISVTIDTSSVDSGVAKFDDHLKSGDFFEVEEYPTATFVSTNVEKTGDNTGIITGDLTIKGVTKPVSLDVKYNTSFEDSRSKMYKIGFSCTTKINRSEFDLGAFVPMVGDEVEISIEAEFQKPIG